MFRIHLCIVEMFEAYVMLSDIHKFMFYCHTCILFMHCCITTERLETMDGEREQSPYTRLDHLTKMVGNLVQIIAE